MYRKLIAFLLLPVALLFVVSAFADKKESVVRVYKHPFKLPNNKYEYVFKNTLIFGHSISSNLMYDAINGAGVYANYFPGAGQLVGPVLSAFFPYAPSPGQVLAEAADGKITNIARGYGDVEVDTTSIQIPLIDKTVDVPTSVAGVFYPENLGLGKLKSFMGQLVRREQSISEAVKLYRQASVLVGVDAFYMGAILNECTGYDVDDTIGSFIQKAARDGKVTILGNMPDEKFEKMRYGAKEIITAALSNDWTSCQTQINDALDQHCVAGNLCYLVNMKEIVNDIDANGAIIQGKHYPYYGLRTDGANLSPAGVQLIIEKIVAALDKSPPLVLRTNSIRRH